MQDTFGKIPREMEQKTLLSRWLVNVESVMKDRKMFTKEKLAWFGR